MARTKRQGPHESHLLRRNIPKSVSTLTLLVVLCLASFLYPSVLNVSALEASFTPAPDKDTGSTDGPLPASQNQRDSLLEMDKLITSSSNPGEMLQKIAEGNGMTAEALGDLLMRNRRDMEMANSGGTASSGGTGPAALNTIPRKMLRVLSSLILVATKSASSHPRALVLTLLVSIAILSMIISAPRTGVVLSTKRSLLSAGHTTIWAPPTKYLSNLLESDEFHSRESTCSGVDGSLSSLFADDDAGTQYEDGTPVDNLSKKQKRHLKFVVMAKKNIPFEVLLPSDEELEFNYNKETEGISVEDKKSVMTTLEEKAWDDAMKLAFASAEKIIISRRFTEYVPSSPNRMRLYSAAKPGGRENAALIFKSMGDWQRFGIQPLRVAQEEDTLDYRSVVYHTLTGGHFDGELRITVKKVDDDEGEESNISVAVTMLVSKNGRKINSDLASKMVLFLAESTAASIITGAKQILTRQQQSSSYRGRAKTKATEKRHIAHENLKQMEDMAEDRRRRWRRNNPNAGRYSPTGHMMKGPGGGGPSYGS